MSTTKKYVKYTLPDEDGYIKGIGWRKIRDIKFVSTKRADVFVGYYRQHSRCWITEGCEHIRVKCILTAKRLDDRWYIVKRKANHD